MCFCVGHSLKIGLRRGLEQDRVTSARSLGGGRASARVQASNPVGARARSSVLEAPGPLPQLVPCRVIRAPELVPQPVEKERSATDGGAATGYTAAPFPRIPPQLNRGGRERRH
ncbi:hypothetical protein GCM10027174_24280 [Salinifilum aidingensis]